MNALKPCVYTTYDSVKKKHDRTIKITAQIYILIVSDGQFRAEDKF